MFMALNSFYYSLQRIIRMLSTGSSALHSTISQCLDALALMKSSLRRSAKDSLFRAQVFLTFLRLYQILLLLY
jgi:hypothetical protein